MSIATRILHYELNGLALIVSARTGILYRNQTGGHSCYQTEIEGYLVPIAGDRPEIVEQLCAHFTGAKWGGWCSHGIDETKWGHLKEETKWTKSTKWGRNGDEMGPQKGGTKWGHKKGNQNGPHKQTHFSISRLLSESVQSFCS